MKHWANSCSPVEDNCPPCEELVFDSSPSPSVEHRHAEQPSHHPWTSELQKHQKYYIRNETIIAACIIALGGRWKETKLTVKDSLNMLAEESTLGSRRGSYFAQDSSICRLSPLHLLPCLLLCDPLFTVIMLVHLFYLQLRNKI